MNQDVLIHSGMLLAFVQKHSVAEYDQAAQAKGLNSSYSRLIMGIAEYRSKIDTILTGQLEERPRALATVLVPSNQWERYRSLADVCRLFRSSLPREVVSMLNDLDH